MSYARVLANPSRDQPAAAGVGAGTATTADKEKRIRQEASKRRRAHILRTKLSEETEEKRYRHALSKRQHVQQEYVRSVRKQFRSWRKQGNPSSHAPAVSGTAHHPQPPWEQKDRPSTPTIGPVSMKQGYVSNNRSPSSTVGVAYTWRKGKGTAIINGSGRGSTPDCNKEAIRVGMTQPKLDVAGDFKYDTNTNVDSGGGVAADRSRTAKGYSRSGRWANLPPELREIKDRWLGESSEEIVPRLTRNDICTASGTAITPAHGDKQYQKPLLQSQEPLWRAVPLDKEAIHIQPNALVEAPASHNGIGGGGGRQGQMCNGAVGEEKQWRGREDDISSSRGSPTGVLEHSRVRGSTRRDVFDTEGRDIRRQQDLVVVAAKRGRPQHPPEQPSALPVATMTHENVRGDTPEPGTIPRHSGERRNTKALVTQETKAGGSDRLAKDDIVPGMHEGLGVTLAPAFGDVLGDPLGDAVENPRDKPRLDKVRNQLRALRSRFPRGAICGIPQAVSPKLLEVQDRFPTPRHATDPISACTQSPDQDRTHVEAGEASQGDQGVGKQGGDERTRVSDGARASRGATSVGGVSPAIVDENSNQVDNDPQGLDGVSFEKGGGTGVEPGRQDTATIIGDLTVATKGGAACRVGQGNGDETTRSGPSELFDSLDLSVSVSQNGGMFTNQGCRSDKVGVVVVPATARPVPTTKVTTPEMTLTKNGQDLKLNKKFKNTAHDPIDVAPPALTVETPSALLDITAGVLSPPPLPLEDTESIGKGRGNKASEGAVTKTLQPECASESPPTAPPKKASTKPSREGPSKCRGGPGVSRLRAPGWGRDVTITSIPPASTAAGGAKTGASSSAITTIRHGATAPTATALLPWDLLTPVTEVATVDEHTVVSYGTGSSTRMTPASSVASGSGPDQGEASVAMRGKNHHRSPYYPPANPHRQAVAGPGVYCLESPLETSGASGGRNQHGPEKRAMWGSGTVGSGAHSAPGKSSANSNEQHPPPRGALSSSSAYRSSPLSGTGDCVAARGSRFSSVSGDIIRPGRQAGGGYVAAMGRRARSMARCEAARRLAAAAMAADRARPSTPISERARWGKGKESQVEVERRKLLQRRAEYAEELQRKAKEDAITLAGSKRVVTTPTVSRADPRHVREGARSSSPTVHEYDNPICDTNMPTGGLKGNIPRAIGANTARDTRYGVIADGQDKPIRGVHGDSVHSPVSSHCGHGSRAGLAGSGGGSSAGRAVGGGGPGVACRRLKAHSQVAPNGRSTDKEEEDRLVASIARLDTLLREENGDADDLNASQNKLGCSNLVSRGRTGSLKARGEMERKPTRVPVGGISKSRVRGGSGKETKNCSSTKPVPTAVQKTGVNHGLPVKRVVSSIPAIGGARDVADATTSISPGMFPSLFCQVQTGSADRGERGRYILADASAAGENGLMREEAAHTAHGRVASPMPYRFTAREGQWQTGRRDDGFVEVVNEHQYCENNRRDFTPACWGTHNNDRYGNSAIDPPRYTVHGEKDWPQQPPSSQGRHRDARSGDDPEGLHGDIGGARGYPGDRVAAIGSRGVHPTALGLERGGSTGWDRRGGGHYLPENATRR